MRVLLQRVTKASVSVREEIIGKIGRGIVVLAGVEKRDSEADVNYLVEKIANLRIFSDEDGKFNLSALDIGGEVLVVSQFTLLADARKGRRPNFINAALPEEAEPLVEQLKKLLQNKGLKVKSGQFGEQMLVEIHNDGPVTLMVDSRGKLKK